MALESQARQAEVGCQGHTEDVVAVGKPEAHDHRAGALHRQAHGDSAFWDAEGIGDFCAQQFAELFGCGRADLSDAVDQIGDELAQSVACLAIEAAHDWQRQAFDPFLQRGERRMQGIGGLVGELVVEHIHRLHHVGEMAAVAAVVGAVVGGVGAAEAVVQLGGMDAGELVVTTSILNEAIVVGPHADLLGRVPVARREGECLAVGGAAGPELPAATAGDLLADRDGHVGRGLAQQGELVGGTFA